MYEESMAAESVSGASVLEVWDRHSPEQRRRNAEEVCRITHYDPRCVASCVAVSLAISALAAGEPVDRVLPAVAQS